MKKTDPLNEYISKKMFEKQIVKNSTQIIIKERDKLKNYNEGNQRQQ